MMRRAPEESLASSGQQQHTGFRKINRFSPYRKAYIYIPLPTNFCQQIIQ